MVFRGLRPRQEAVRMAIEPKKYETLYLVRPDISPEDLLTIQNRVEQSVAGNGGEMIKSEKWAERDLAYRIENYTRGTYYIAVYAAESKAVTDIERYFNLSKNNVLRFMTVKYIEEEQKTAGGGMNVPPQPSEQEDQSAFQSPSSESESQAEGNGEPPQEAAEQVQGDEGSSHRKLLNRFRETKDSHRKLLNRFRETKDSHRKLLNRFRKAKNRPKEI